MKNVLLKYKFSFILTTLFNVISAFLSLLFAVILGEIIQSAIYLNAKLFMDIIVGLLILILIFVSKNVASYFRRMYVVKTSVDYKNNLLAKILELDYEEFFIQNNSYYTNALVNEANIIRTEYIENFSYIIENFIQLLVSIIGLFLISYQLAFMMICFVLLYLLIPKFFGKALNKYNINLTVKNEKLLSVLKSLFQGYEVIKTFNIIDRSVKNYKNINEQQEKANVKFKSVNDVKNITTELLAFIMMLSMISLGAFLLYKKVLTVTFLFASIQLINNVINPISYLFMYLSNFNSTSSIREKHLNLFNLSLQKPKKEEIVHDTNIDINIKNLSFGYEEDNIINNFSYKFYSGKKYALIGMSGSGKSTLLKLIAGYYNNYNGTIYYGDVNLKNANRESFYGIVTVIHQNIFIFEDTLISNIKLGKEIEEKDYYRILEKTNLLEVEKRLKDNIIYDNGKGLSGGEKQRIAIARSLVQKASILLVDEATSNLDSENTSIINNILLSLENVICIIITHDPNVEFLNRFDNIIELKGKKSET